MTARADLEQLAEATANAAGVPVALFKGLIAHESGWNPRAIRLEPAISDASRGLGQILFRTAKGWGYTGTPEGLFDPATNLRLAATGLARLRQQFGSWEGALAAYNGGPRAGVPVAVATDTVLARDQQTGQPIRRYTAQPGQFRNQPYVDAVLAAARRYGSAVASTVARVTGSRGSAHLTAGLGVAGLVVVLAVALYLRLRR